MLRKYQYEDELQLLTVWESASKKAHPFLSAEFIAQERENISKIYLPNTETWIYEEDGNLIGFLSLLGNEVGAIFVQPDKQRKGIGQQLMDKARQLYGTLEVEVFSENPIGPAFYAKYGFKVIEEKIHEPTGFGLLRMRYSTQ